MDTLGKVFTNTARLHHRCHNTLFTSFDLHHGQHRLFFELKNSDGISQKELAERMDITPATLTRMVQNLEKKGYITRETKELDKRVTLIHLTDKGKKVHQKLHKKFSNMDEKIFNIFSIEEKKIFKKMLFKIQKQLLEEIEVENNH